METHSPDSAPSHDQIADRARAIWEQSGHPEGRDLEVWLQAERELRDHVSIGGSPLPTNVEHPLPMNTPTRTARPGRVR